jgi:hypothetical protein
LGEIGLRGRGFLEGKFNFVDTYVTTYYKPLPPKKYFRCTPDLSNKLLFSVSSQQKTSPKKIDFYFRSNGPKVHNKGPTKQPTKQPIKAKKNFLTLF